MGIKIPVDFTGVEARATVRVVEGDYKAKVIDINKTKAKSSGNPMLVVTFELREGPDKEAKGKRIKDNHVMTKESLWTLRNMLEAMGFKVPSGPMKLDTNSIKGRAVGVTIVDGDEYKGRIKSEIADYISPSLVGKKVTAEESDDLLDEDDDDEADDWEDEDESDDSDDSDDDSDDSDDEEDEEESDDSDDEDEDEVELTFGPSEIEEAKVPELKSYLKEAMDAGFEFKLSDKPKKSEVVEALLTLFEDEDDDDEMDEFDLDDV